MLDLRAKGVRKMAKESKEKDCCEIKVAKSKDGLVIKVSGKELGKCLETCLKNCCSEKE
jgi:hypothetical protein